MGDDSLVLCTDSVLPYFLPGDNSDPANPKPSHAPPIAYPDNDWGLQAQEVRRQDGLLYCR